MDSRISDRDMRRARAARSLLRFRRIQPHVGRIQAALLRRSAGRVRRSRVLAGGQPVLSLTTKGRRTGKPRSTTVAYVRVGGSLASAGLNLGSDHDPAWVLNLRAEPDAVIEVSGERREVRAREAEGEEAERIWGALIEQLPTTAASRELAQRDVPVFVWAPRDG